MSTFAESSGKEPPPPLPSELEPPPPLPLISSSSLSLFDLSDDELPSSLLLAAGVICAASFSALTLASSAAISSAFSTASINVSYSFAVDRATTKSLKRERESAVRVSFSRSWLRSLLSLASPRLLTSALYLSAVTPETVLLTAVFAPTFISIASGPKIKRTAGKLFFASSRSVISTLIFSAFAPFPMSQDSFPSNNILSPGNESDLKVVPIGSSFFTCSKEDALAA